MLKGYPKREAKKKLFNAEEMRNQQKSFYFRVLKRNIFLFLRLYYSSIGTYFKIQFGQLENLTLGKIK